MTKYFLAVWVLFLPVPAFSEDVVWVDNIPFSSGVVPDSQILIRNASDYDLSIWVANSDEDWKQYEVNAENSVIIEMADAVVGIATTENDSEDNTPPVREPSSVSGEGEIDGLYHLRKLSGGTRALFCWSPSRDRWMIQSFGERICS